MTDARELRKRIEELEAAIGDAVDALNLAAKMIMREIDRYDHHEVERFELKLAAVEHVYDSLIEERNK